MLCGLVVHDVHFGLESLCGEFIELFLYDSNILTLSNPAIGMAKKALAL